MHEISTPLHEHWERHGSRDSLDPITVARQHAIRELCAAAIDATKRPPPHTARLDAAEVQVFEKELEFLGITPPAVSPKPLRVPCEIDRLRFKHQVINEGIPQGAATIGSI